MEKVRYEEMWRWMRELIDEWRTRSISRISVVAFGPNHGGKALTMANGWRYARWDLVPWAASRAPTLTAALWSGIKNKTKQELPVPSVKGLQVTGASYLRPSSALFTGHR